MANPNIVNVNTIYGNTNVLAIGTSYANVVQNPTSSNSIYKINTLTVASSCTASLTVSLQINQAGTNTNIAANVAVPAGSVLVLMGKDTPVYLLENNSLQLNASSASFLTAVCSWEQIS